MTTQPNVPATGLCAVCNRPNNWKHDNQDRAIWPRHEFTRDVPESGSVAAKEDEARIDAWLHSRSTHFSGAGMQALHDRIRSDRAKIEEMSQTLGPKMACGCYAVEMLPSRGVLFCKHHHRGTRIPAEYLRWEESR